MRKSARILCNAAGQIPRLTIAADIRPSMDSLDVFTIAPYSLDLDATRADDEQYEFSFTLKNLSEESLDFKVVSLPDEFVHIDLPTNVSLGGGEERKFLIRFDGGIAGELFSESITLEASDNAKTRMTIPVSKSRRWGPAPTSSAH